MGKFVNGEIYHVFNKSIASYGIFKDITNGKRFIEALDYYNKIDLHYSLSGAKILKNYKYVNLLDKRKNPVVDFISYCIMPDHYHLLVKLQAGSLSKYINDIENSFTRFFNIKFERKGPLWQSSFKSVRIENNEQLLHVSRYIHLNPTTNELVKKPGEWILSSYNDLAIGDYLKKIKEISIKNKFLYKEFVEDQIDYQILLKKIKRKLLD